MPNKINAASGVMEMSEIEDTHNHIDGHTDNLSLLEIMEENWRSIFAVLVCLVVVFVIGVAVLVFSNSNTVEDSNGDETSLKPANPLNGSVQSEHDKLK